MDLTTPAGGETKGERHVIAGIGGDWSTYAVGDIVTCISVFPTVWTKDTPKVGWQINNLDDGINYTVTSLSPTVWTAAADITGKADKAVPTTPDSVAGLDASGNLYDTAVTTADMSAAVSASHTQGTDQGLDTGGANAVTAAEAKEAYDKRAVWDGDLGCLIFTI
jgi:hypothetical protein